MTAHALSVTPLKDTSSPRPLVASHAAPPILLPRQPDVVVVTDADAARPYLPSWDALARDAIEPNAFYEPWALLPAVASFGLQDGMELVFVFTDAERGRSLLVGVFPFRREARYNGIPISTLGPLQHNYCYLGTPLIRLGHAKECLDRLFDWLRSERGAALVEFSRITADGPFHQALTDVLNERGCLSCVRSCHTRALFRPLSDGDTYITTALRIKRRKEFQRLEKRLGELGQLRYDELAPQGDLRGWTKEFLDLEASGWKGAARTAFASHEADRRYLEVLTGEAFRRGRLMMLALRLDGRAVALKYNLLAGDGSFAFKIAYDEAFARFSPGVLLELENIRRLHGRGDLRWMDSGARAQHPMINRLWMHRRTIQTLLVSPGQPSGELVVSALPLWRWLRRRLGPSLPAAGSAAPEAAPEGPSNEEVR